MVSACLVSVHRPLHCLLLLSPALFSCVFYQDSPAYSKLGPCHPYLHFPVPWSCSFVPISTSPFTLHRFTIFASKVVKMKMSVSRMWTLSFSCLRCLDAWPEEVEAEYCKPMSFTTSVLWATRKVEALGATANPSITYSVQLVVPCRDPDLYPASSVCESLNTKSNGRLSRVAVNAMERTDEQH